MSPARLKNSLSEIKPFRLVKFFAIASFIVLLLVSFPFSLFISQRAKEIIFNNYHHYVLEVGAHMELQINLGFFMPLRLNEETVSLSNKRQMEMLDAVIRNAIENVNVEVVKLHSIYEGVVIYSTDPGLSNEKSVITDGYLTALNGDISSELLTGEKGLWGFGIERIRGKKIVRTYIPLKVPLEYNRIVIAGILEMELDMTDQYRAIVKLQYQIFGISILMMTLIFFALLLIVHKAEKIIAKRNLEQRELVEQLNLAERLAALGEMVAGVSHEIKNPLGIIQSTAEFLNGMPDSNAIQKRLSGVITEEAIRLNRIVTEFLDFARPHELNIRECRLNMIIEKNLEFMKPEIDKNRIFVKTDIPVRGCEIFMDQDLIHRVLMNIIMNAIQAMENGGTLSVTTAESKGGYNITVQDTGSGISPDNIKKIFNPFFTTKEKGSGLGLPIVRKIIEGHNGTIDIESVEGEGTKVVIYLPRRY